MNAAFTSTESVFTAKSKISFGTPSVSSKSNLGQNRFAPSVTSATTNPFELRRRQSPVQSSPSIFSSVSQHTSDPRSVWTWILIGTIGGFLVTVNIILIYLLLESKRQPVMATELPISNP